MHATLKIPAKINLGLNIVSKRTDGYHNLETVFYPVPLYDELTMEVLSDSNTTSLHIDGLDIAGDVSDNLVLRAYRLLSNDFEIPPLRFNLKKNIPTQAGMGGGSADAAYTLLLLNKEFCLGLNETALADYAKRLGADCPFFVYSKPCFATGIGEQLEVIDLDLKGLEIIIIKPDVAISTKEAFSLVEPRMSQKKCREIVSQPIETWRDELKNDFEVSAFSLYPQLAEIKKYLYESGALYASMTGSGSAMFGIFSRPLKNNNSLFCQGNNNYFLTL